MIAKVIDDAANSTFWSSFDAPTGSIAEQKQIIEDAFNNGIDGLSVSPIDAQTRRNS
jgi:ABC-type sugar transport system substrate-binding protein